MQAENQRQSEWAVASRTTNPSRAELDTLLDDGRLIRTQVLRPTWHYVHADDLGWLLDRPRSEIAEQLICSGRPRDGEHSYALFAERIPQPRRLDRDAALAELALRYFTGHGPATDRDLAGDEVEALERAAQRCGDFLGLPYRWSSSER